MKNRFAGTEAKTNTLLLFTPSPMTKQSAAQRTGSPGERLVAEIIASTGGWIVRSQEEDFGVDLEAELSDPEVTGKLLKLQIKTSASIKETKRGVPFQIDRSLVAYAEACRLPVILVRVDLNRREAWYCWLQRWILHKRRSGIGIGQLPRRISDYITLGATLWSARRFLYQL